MRIKYYFLLFLRALRSRFFLQEKKAKHFGELNQESKIYIIKRDDERVGLFSNVIIFLGYMKYALKKNYIPVIDMMNYPNSYLENDKTGLENSWEYYFEQPCACSLYEAYQSANVVVSHGAPWDYPCDDPFFFKYKKVRNEWREFARKYLRVNHFVRDYVDKMHDRLFLKGEKVLGIKCRGTDYIKLKPKGHPIQPNI